MHAARIRRDPGSIDSDVLRRLRLGPSVSLPCGSHPDSGMPVGLHMAAARWREDVLLRAAAGYERAR